MSKAELYQYFLSNTAWLYYKVYQNEWFFFDLWTVVHFGSGVVFYLFFQKTFKDLGLKIFILALVIYELFEILLLYFMVRIILPETFKDQLTDIGIGLLGGFMANIYLKFPKSIKPYFRLFFISCVFGYLLVGFKAFLPEINQNKTLSLNIGLIVKVFIFSYFNMYLSDFLFEKIKNRIGLLFLIGSIIIISAFIFLRWINTPSFDFSSLLLYASIIILANRLIWYLVNLWETRKKYSFSDYYSGLFRRFQDWPTK